MTNNLPTLPQKRLTEVEKRNALVRRVQETKQELDHTWHDLKRDSITAVVGAASIYVGYRLARWLLGGGKKTKQAKQPKEVEVRYIETREPKRSNGWINMLLSRAGSIVVDIVLEKVQDNIQFTSKKDKKQN